MADQEVVTLVARAKDEASAQLAKVDLSMQSLSKTAASTGKSFLGLNSTLAGLAGPVAAGVAIGALAGFLGDATQAAIEDEQSQARLKAALEANVPAYGGNTDAIEKWITAQQKLGFSDDELRSSMSKLVAVTHDTAEAQSVLATAEDLARFKGISLEDASQSLVKVEAGRYRALADLGIQIKANASQEEALAAVQAVAAGQAVAFGNTTAGAMQEAGIAVNELVESIGYSLAPVVKDFAQAMTTTVVPALQQGVGMIATLLAPVASAADAVRLLVTATQQLGQEQVTANQTFEAANPALDSLNRSIGMYDDALKNGSISVEAHDAAVANLTQTYNESPAGLEAAAEHTATVGRENNSAADAADRASGAFRTLGVALSNTTGTLKDIYSSTVSLTGVMGGLQGSVYGAAAGVNTAGDAVSTLEGNLRSAYGIIISDANAALFLARGMNAAAIQAQYAAASVAAFKAGHPTNPNLPAGSADSPHNVGFNVGSINSAGDQAALDEYNQSLGPNFGYVPPKDKKKGGGGGGKKSGISDAAKAAEEAKKAIASAYQDATRTIDSYYDKLHADNGKAIDDAHRVRDQQIKDAHTAANEKIKADREASKQTLKDALAAIATEKAARRAANAAPVTAAEDAQSKIEAAQQLRDLQESLATANAGGDAIAIRNATEALSNFQAHQGIDALKSAQQAADAAADAWADASIKAANDAEAVREADLDARQVAEDKRYADAQTAEDKRYANQQHAEDVRWEAQRKKYDDQIRATESGTKATLANAHATQLLYLQQALTLAKGSGTAADVVAAQKELDDFKAQLKAAPGKAGGGRVNAGSLYRVGENGPEFFVPGMAGTIVAAGAGAAGPAGPITINVHGVGDPDAVANRVMLALKREADRQGMGLQPTGSYSR